MKKSFEDLIGRVEDRLEKSGGHTSPPAIPASIASEFMDMSVRHHGAEGGRFSPLHQRHNAFGVGNHTVLTHSVVSDPGPSGSPLKNSIHKLHIEQQVPQGEQLYTHTYHSGSEDVPKTVGPMNHDQTVKHLRGLHQSD